MSAALLPSVLQLVNPVAPRAIVVGDPGRALALAQRLLDRPLMCNHRRGLWGYTGAASDGEPLTIQSTGVGGASAAPVIRELAAAGITRMVRAGTAIDRSATAPVPLAIVTTAIARDGVSRALGVADGTRLLPDPALTARLEAAVPATRTLASVDLLPHDGGPPADGGDAIDRQTAAFLAAAARWGVAAAAIVGFPAPVEDEQQRDAGWHALGDAAAAAYALRPVPPRPVTPTGPPAERR